MDQTYEELLAVLPEAVRDRVLAGELVVFPGKDEAKPVLRDAVTGALVKGTGISPRAVDIGKISAATSYKRTKTYRQVLEEAVPASSDPGIRRSVGWIVSKLEEAMDGGVVKVKAACPECAHEFYTEAYRKPDTYAAIKLLELVHGRARETQDINLKMVELHKILEERTPPGEIRVHVIGPDESKHRRAVIEGNFVDLPAN